MELSFTILDVFTSTRYAGNPLAVVLVPSSVSQSISQAQKQLIAREFNLSETVFLHLEDKSEEGVQIDIFTPYAELPFAGHPTIGSAYYLLSTCGIEAKALLTKAGNIPISLDPQADIVRAEVPHDVRIHSMTASSSWTVEPAPIVSIVKSLNFVLASLDSISTLSKPRDSIHKDTYDPTGLDSGWESGLICTYFYVLLGADEAGRQNVRTRLLGMGEDPATGSAASALCSYLALQEDKAKGKGPFGYNITQGVEMGRESHIGVDIVRSEDGSSIMGVTLSGKAVVGVMKGHVMV